jgi:superfamily II DNA/RNA helicase
MVHQRALHFDELEVLVIDEADRMLDMGCIDDIHNIIERLPESRQNLLFSATLSDDVRALAACFSNENDSSRAVEINIAPKTTSAKTIDQWLVTVDKDRKSALLSHMILDQQWGQTLIFIEKKHAAAKLVSQLEKRGIKADSIHGDRSQAMREKTLADFKSGELKYLVATGVAARGIDIESLERVVNYDLPFKPEEYIHRIGRTGRAGALGEAISLVAWGDFKNLCAIESRLGHVIKRKEFEDFPIRKVVPVSILDYVPRHLREDRHDAPRHSNRPAQTSSPYGNKPSTRTQPQNSESQSEGGSVNQHIWGK